MKSIQKYSGYIMIAVVVACALSLFCYVNAGSNTQKESFESDEKKKFTITKNSPGKKEDVFYINKSNKLMNSSTDESVHPHLTFERKENEIVGKIRYDTEDVVIKKNNNNTKDKNNNDDKTNK